MYVYTHTNAGMDIYVYMFSRYTYMYIFTGIYSFEREKSLWLCGAWPLGLEVTIIQVVIVSVEVGLFPKVGVP